MFGIYKENNEVEVVFMALSGSVQSSSPASDNTSGRPLSSSSSRCMFRNRRIKPYAGEEISLIYKVSCTKKFIANSEQVINRGYKNRQHFLQKNHSQRLRRPRHNCRVATKLYLCTIRCYMYTQYEIKICIRTCKSMCHYRTVTFQ